MKNLVKIILVALFISMCSPSWGQQKINWFSFEQALDMNAQRLSQGLTAKKIFIDVYTDWCGWCKRLDATTFANEEIVKYMSDKFIAVKLNAERKDTVIINNQTFAYNPSVGRNGIHDLAVVLLRNKLSYPSCTFLDESGKQLDIIPGFMDAKAFEVLLHFFGEDAYKTTEWESFKTSFKGNVIE